jgi:hypothetical protein
MAQLKRFFDNFVVVLIETREAYTKRHLDHLLGS